MSGLRLGSFPITNINNQLIMMTTPLALSFAAFPGGDDPSRIYEIINIYNSFYKVCRCNNHKMKSQLKTFLS